MELYSNSLNSCLQQFSLISDDILLQHMKIFRFSTYHKYKKRQCVLIFYCCHLKYHLQCVVFYRKQEVFETTSKTTKCKKFQLCFTSPWHHKECSFTYGSNSEFHIFQTLRTLVSFVKNIVRSNYASFCNFFVGLWCHFSLYMAENRTIFR